MVVTVAVAVLPVLVLVLVLAPVVEEMLQWWWDITVAAGIAAPGRLN